MSKEPGVKRPLSMGEMWFVFAIMVILSWLIISLSLSIGPNPKAAQELDFAGMLLSDGLAFVAIFYTMIQGWINRKDNDRIVDAVERLNLMSAQTNMDIRNFSDELQRLKAVSNRLNEFVDSKELIEKLGTQLMEMQRISSTPLDLPDTLNASEITSKKPSPDKERLTRLVKMVAEASGTVSSFRQNINNRSRWKVTLSIGRTLPSRADLSNLENAIQRSFFTIAGSASFTFLPVELSDATKLFKFILDVTTAIEISEDTIKSVLTEAEIPPVFEVRSVEKEI